MRVRSDEVVRVRSDEVGKVRPDEVVKMSCEVALGYGDSLTET